MPLVPLSKNLHKFGRGASFKGCCDVVKDKKNKSLSQLGDGLISHIDLRNQNVEFIEEDEARDRPAVFIEFGEIIWDPYKGTL